MKGSLLGFIAVAAVTVSPAAVAEAAVLQDPANSDYVKFDPLAAGDSFGVDYVCTTSDTCGDEGSPDIDLTAMTNWTLTGVAPAGAPTSLEFTIEVMNTTDDPFSTTNRITQFGVKFITAEPDTTFTVGVTSGNWDATTDTTFPTFQEVDLNVDNAMGNFGVLEGSSQTVVVTVDFDAVVSALELEVFPIKFQGVGADEGSFEFAGTVKDGQIPLPHTLWLLGAGLVAAGMAMRRPRR